MGRQVCLTIPAQGHVVADVLSPSEGCSGGGEPCGRRLYHCSWTVFKGGVMQTLAQSGSTKTEPPHSSHRYPAHEEGPPHYGAKAGSEHKTSLTSE